MQQDRRYWHPRDKDPAYIAQVQAEYAKAFPGQVSTSQEKESYPSALALAVYSLEESGKYLLDRWKDNGFKIRLGKKPQLHKEKQQAIAGVFAALVATDAIFEFLSTEVKDMDGLREVAKKEPSDAFREHVAKALYSSKRARLMDEAVSGVTEGVKHICLYVDRSWIRKKLIYSRITKEDAADFIDSATKALELLDDALLDKVARAILQVKIDQPNKGARPEATALA